MNNKIIYRILGIAILLLAIFSCSAKDMKTDSGYKAEYKEASAVEDAELESSGDVSNFSEVNESEDYTIDRKLIKRGQIEFQSENITEAKAFIAKLVKKHKAYISEENESSAYSRILYHLEIRIPKDNFDSFLSELSAGVEKFDQKNISVEDVTEEFIDINARLKIKKETERQYLQLLKQARTVQDILEVQNQLQILRSDIESIEGRLKYLTKQVNFSTLNIDIYQELKELVKSDSIFKRMWRAIKQGVYNFIEIILVLLEAWLLIAVLIIAFVLIRKLRLKKKQEKIKDDDDIKIKEDKNE